MNEREAEQAIITQFKTAWAVSHPADAPIVLDNEIGETTSKWVRLDVQYTTSQQVTMGSAPNRKFRRNGIVMVQLFSPANQGRGPLADLATDAREALEGKHLGELHLHAGSTQKQPTDGVWAMAVVTVPFWFTETR